GGRVGEGRGAVGRDGALRGRGIRPGPDSRAMAGAGAGRRHARLARRPRARSGASSATRRGAGAGATRRARAAGAAGPTGFGVRRRGAPFGEARGWGLDVCVSTVRWGPRSFSSPYPFFA